MTEPTLTEDRLFELIDRDTVASLAARLVRAPGENPPGQEQATVDVLLEACRAFELDHRVDPVRPGRPNLTVRLPGGERPGLLLLGHSDVVPVGDGWTVDPHAGTIRDGRLYGRGAADMKGGLAAMLVAMAAARRARIPVSGPVELAVTMDEEEAALGIGQYVASGDRGDFLGCVVGEPTDLQPITAARGDAYLTIAIRGRAAHAGRPSDGLNAIDAAGQVIADLRQWHHELAADAHPLVGPATSSIGLIDGGAGASIVAADCRLTVDRRLLPTETGEQVLDQLRRRLDRLRLVEDGYRLSTELTLDMPGFETPPEDPLVQAVTAGDAQAGGPRLPPGGWTAACDGGFLARDAGLPVVVYGPGSVEQEAHRADESVPLDQLVIAARSYLSIILRLLGVP